MIKFILLNSKCTYYIFYFSSENSETITSRIQNSSDKYEESGLDDTGRKTVTSVTEKVLSVPYEKKKLSEISASSSSSSSDSSSSDSDTDDSSGKYD